VTSLWSSSMVYDPFFRLTFSLNNLDHVKDVECNSTEVSSRAYPRGRVWGFRFLGVREVHVVENGGEMLCMHKHKNTRKIHRFRSLARNTLHPLLLYYIALVKFEGCKFRVSGCRSKSL
jgi:hypothetical protein